MAKETICNGFILPDGELISLYDVERMFAVAKGAMGTPEETSRLMMELGRECGAKERRDPALAYFGKALDLLGPGEMKARCLLAIGQLTEGHDDYAGALDSYLVALRMEPVDGGVRYLLHHSAGYCLNRLGRHPEAEGICRKAITIDPGRFNAHKNLGVALEELGRYPEAVASYVTAVENNPVDNRALQLLERLIRAHRAVEKEVQGLPERIEACRGRVAAGGTPWP